MQVNDEVFKEFNEERQALLDAWQEEMLKDEKTDEQNNSENRMGRKAS